MFRFTLNNRNLSPSIVSTPDKLGSLNTINNKHLIIQTYCMRMVNTHGLSSTGSFCVKSPNELNPTVSDFNQTWYTCCLGTHSTKSKILGQSDQWCGRYGPPNFESFGKNGRGCQPLNPHSSRTSDPIFIKLVLMDRQLDKDSKYVILVQIGECLGALTF